MKYYTCDKTYVTSYNVPEKNRMYLIKRNIKGKHDDEIKALCPELAMQILKRVGAQHKNDRNEYKILLENHHSEMIVTYNCGAGIDCEPTLTDVIWSLIQDASMLDEYLDVDEFLTNTGYDSDMASVRKGEQIWRDIIKQTKELRKLRIPIQQLQKLLQDY